jgi:hypothetical protein
MDSSHTDGNYSHKIVQMEILEISNLQKVQASESVNPIIKEIIRGLLVAINDWPNPIAQLEDFELQVCKFIGSEVTKNNLRECLSQLNLSKNAWHAESLSELSDVFKLYGYEISLKEVIRDLRANLIISTS